MANTSKISFQLGDITNANLEQLRIIHINTLPVRYSDKFYKDLLSTYSPEYMKFAFVNGFSVGAVCARVEAGEVSQSCDEDGFVVPSNLESTSDKKKLYIMTLGVLAAYRRCGLATALLNYVLDTAAKDTEIAEVYLHVQINNADAIQFYTHHGFEQVGVIREYYKRIDPPDCFLYRKKLHNSDRKDSA